jgi:hypothetical protein
MVGQVCFSFTGKAKDVFKFGLEYFTQSTKGSVLSLYKSVKERGGV